MAICKHVLHHSGNTLSKGFLAMLGAGLGVEWGEERKIHHFAGAKRLLGSDVRADAIRAAIAAPQIPDAPLDPAQQAALHYA